MYSVEGVACGTERPRSTWRPVCYFKIWKVGQRLATTSNRRWDNCCSRARLTRSVLERGRFSRSWEDISIFLSRLFFFFCFILFLDAHFDGERTSRNSGQRNAIVGGRAKHRHVNGRKWTLLCLLWLYGIAIPPSVFLKIYDTQYGERQQRASSWPSARVWIHQDYTIRVFAGRCAAYLSAGISGKNRSCVCVCVVRYARKP